MDTHREQPDNDEQQEDKRDGDVEGDHSIIDDQHVNNDDAGDSLEDTE